MAEDNDDPKHKIGYKKPPLTTRFKPGQSGNPKGRPKKEPKTVETEEAMIERILAEKLTLANGKQMIFQEALLRKALNKAAEKGNLKLLRDLMKISSSSEADTTDYRAEDRVPARGVAGFHSHR